MFVVGLVLLLAPLLLGRGMLNKYLVVVGFIGACLGICFVINGAFDWLREKRT